MHKCSQYNLLAMTFDAQMPCFEKGQLSLSNFSGRNSTKISVSPEQK